MTTVPVRLLLLEDNPGDARLVQAALAEHSPGEFAVTRVERLADALERIASGHFEAVLCDLGLPDSTGVATAEVLAARFPALPLVVLTGSHDEDLGREAIRHGAQDYLVKGESSGVLIVRTLRYAIERKQLEIGLRTANEALERRVGERTAELQAALGVLRLSETRYRSLFENMLNGFAYCRMKYDERERPVDFVYLEVNRAFERLTGLKNVVGKPVTAVIPGIREANPELFEIYGRVASTGIPETFEIDLKPLRQWFAVSVYGPERGHFVAVFDVITERKLAERELAESAMQFRAMVEQSIAGILIIQDGKFAYVNPRLVEVHGYASQDELVGTDPLTLFVERDRPAAVETIRRLLSGEVNRISHTLTALRKDGSTVELGINSARASYRGRPAIIAMMQDISEKKHAEEQIVHYVAQLEAAFMSTVKVATTLGEMRDPYTAGHERRVAEIAVAIGAEIGFDPRRQEGLRVAGYLHDVGKITIPSEILAKPGKLSPIEFKLIQGHARASYDVLKDVEFPWPVAQVALQHHERMDGSGYPQGLKGDAILLEARIMAVADVVEAMSSHRPYRAGLGIDKALAEVERGRGSPYDATIADACLRLFREKGYAIPA